jgi:hypothetical protein
MDLITLSRIDGQPFTLTGFAGAESHQGRPDLWASGIRVTGSSGRSAEFRLDFINDASGPADDFQLFAVPSSLRKQFVYRFSAVPGLNPNDSFYSLDNLDVAPAPVPEPCSMLLLASGLGAAGLHVRRKRRRGSSV